MLCIMYLYTSNPSLFMYLKVLSQEKVDETKKKRPIYPLYRHFFFARSHQPLQEMYMLIKFGAENYACKVRWFIVFLKYTLGVSELAAFLAMSLRDGSEVCISFSISLTSYHPSSHFCYSLETLWTLDPSLEPSSTRDLRIGNIITYELYAQIPFLF